MERKKIIKKWRRLFYNNKHNRYCLVSRLILECFIGPCPLNKQCAHNNGIRTDNRLENLRWATKSENEADKKLHGTIPDFKGENNPRCKLLSQQVLDIRTRKMKQREYAEKYNIARSTVACIQCRVIWKHL